LKSPKDYKVLFNQRAQVKELEKKGGSTERGEFKEGGEGEEESYPDPRIGRGRTGGGG